MAKRGDRVAPPPRASEWDLRFGDGAAACGWDDLCRQAPGPTRDAYDILAKNPRNTSSPGRQFRLKGELVTRMVAGVALEQWQIEVTGGGRIWYCIDEKRRRVIVVLASTKHPKETE